MINSSSPDLDPPLVGESRRPRRDTPFMTDADFGIEAVAEQIESMHLEQTIDSNSDDQAYIPQLEVRVCEYKPRNLSGTIVMKSGPPAASGGFASVHCGYWRGRMVR